MSGDISLKDEPVIFYSKYMTASKVMSEFKAGKLKSGGDKTVTKRKQAIAIGLAMEQKAHRKKSK